jgi:UDP-N-acetylmuramate--alanine ligase
MANVLGVDWDAGSNAISAYRGVARRLERRGVLGGATFVDDYGHLPSEVRAAIAACRDGAWRRLVVVFQPHRYSRTRDQWRGFADAFEGADVLLLTDIYAAGEDPLPGVSGRLVYEAVTTAHPQADVTYIPTLDGVAATLPAILGEGDLCLTLGAGDVTRLADMVISDDHPGGAVIGDDHPGGAVIGDDHRGAP